MAHEREINIGREVAPIEEPSLRLVDYEGYYGLCHDAEVFLDDDIKSGEVVLVNDTFLMKRTGEYVGVAVVERSVEGGEIKFGRWYGPKSYILGGEIRKALKSGETSMDIPGESTWVTDRELDQDIWSRRITGEQLMEKAIKAAEKIRNKKVKNS